MRIIIDTNLWISYLINKRVNLRDICLNEDISVFYCDKIVEEFLRISDRRLRGLGKKL